MSDSIDPHGGQKVLHSGPAPETARRTAIFLHGRGASAPDILGLTAALHLSDVAFLAPEAAGHTWYPLSFLAPIERNEPWLTSALNTVNRLVTSLEARGVPSERIAIGGFSQGACLTLEFAARHPRRYAALLGLSGGLIGPPGTPRQYEGSLIGTSVFLGCSDVDPHIPLDRVKESADVFARMGATVDTRIYPGMGHLVNDDELAAVQALLGRS